LPAFQSDDLGTGMTGVMLAEFLGSAHATVIIAVEATDAKTLRVKRETRSGINETVELSMPAVLTIQFGINQPSTLHSKASWLRRKKS